jgi:hypothetical protein
MEAAVDDLLRKFEALEDPPASTGAATASTDTGLVDDTFIVAGPNSRPEITKVADFTTDEVNDEVEFNLGLNAYAYNPPISGINTGPRVIIAAGLYKLDGTVTMTQASALLGVGRGTQFELLTAAAEIVMTSFCEVGNFLVEFGPGA